jgi:hypothetical protein
MPVSKLPSKRRLILVLRSSKYCKSINLSIVRNPLLLKSINCFLESEALII